MTNRIFMSFPCTQWCNPTYVEQLHFTIGFVAKYTQPMAYTTISLDELNALLTCDTNNIGEIV